MTMEQDSIQDAAIELCCDLDKRVVAVTGQAGTGKTTIIKQAYEALEQLHLCVVCAPTGKAARRIREATGLHAITIHKLLEYPRPGEFDPKTGKPLDTTVPSRSRSNPLLQNVVFVDEYAMVNYELHNNLLAALPRGGCIRCFGDVSQLPPIEENKIQREKRTPFERLLDEQPSVRLETVFRQAEGSQVLAAARSIRVGLMPKNSIEFHYTVTDRPVVALKKMVVEKGETGTDFRLLENQIITPSNKTWTGTYALNGMLRGLLNPKPTFELRLPREKWMEQFPVKIGIGDKVVCTENTYDFRNYEDRYEDWLPSGEPDPRSFIPTPDTKQMLNGETGIVTEIYPDGSLEIDFGDRTVEIPEFYYEFWQKGDTMLRADARKRISLAYALTTHKCQGSEFDAVIYVMNRSTSFMQGRQNFYTAVTRAKRKAFIISDSASLQSSIRNKVKL